MLNNDYASKKCFAVAVCCAAITVSLIMGINKKLSMQRSISQSAFNELARESLQSAMK